MALLTTRWVEARLYDKNLNPAGVVLATSGDAQSVSFTPEHNGVGTGTITLPVDHKLVTPLLSPGTRVKYLYRDSNFGAVDKMSGCVVDWQLGLGPLGAVVTFTMVSDNVLLRCLGWPNPLAAIGSQPEYDTRTGQVDLMAHNMIRDNLITRLGLPVTMVPFTASGPTKTLQARMHPLVDVIRPAFEESGFGIKLYQWNSGDPEPATLSGALFSPTVLAEVYRITDRPYVRWTTMQGITSGTASAGAPTATRVVVGGQGEGALRSWTAKVETTRETEWGPLAIREVMVDARDAADAATVTQRADEALKEGQARASLSATTTDGEPWTVGTHYNLGDRTVIAAVTGEPVASEVVRSITYTHTAKEGITVTPQIGDPSVTASPDQWLAKALRSVGGRLTSLEARK